MTDTWKRCSSCKKDIPFSSTYYVCSVSTCTKKRTGFTFCSVECWETHLPMMRHREAWAVEEKAPTRAEWEASGDDDDPVPSRGASAPARASAPAPTSDAPRRRRVVEAADAPAASAGAAPREVLVIASRFKAYVKQRFGMNTSDGVMDPLSDHLRTLCHRAAENARAEGRKTLLDRDFEFLKKS